MASGASAGQTSQRRSAVGESLLRLIQARPGIHFRALGRAANIPSAGQLRYHLDRLRKVGLVVEAHDGKFTRFMLVDQNPARIRPAIVHLARPAAARIGRMLLHGPMRRVELRRRLGLADSTLSYHMGRLIAAGCVEKRGRSGGCEYTLVDPVLVREALAIRTGSLETGRPTQFGAPASLAPPAEPSPMPTTPVPAPDSWAPAAA